METNMDNDIITLVRHFNTNTSFEKVLSINDYQIGQLMRSIEQLGVDAIKEAFDRAERSLFLSGKKVPTWKASFGWLIKQENLKNILNGKYDDYKSTRTMLPTDVCDSSPSNTDLYDSSLSDADELVSAALARGFDDLFNEK
jgi:hypothetical protein